ncbi:unnamed protein product [Nippostrongylus brasiliensis]|uniref:Uncharacterized protein n=1 Tax=Nippostrongylus brasiliensis TaxID=27835 RepID=A0A0N4XQ25_NIPBR|nr:unnamed protein product [Nippostrongylus brasiliensis]
MDVWMDGWMSIHLPMIGGGGEQCDNGDLLSSYDSVQSRPEMSALPPVMLMPSVDPEVIHMQKEVRRFHIDSDFVASEYYLFIR